MKWRGVPSSYGLKTKEKPQQYRLGDINAMTITKKTIADKIEWQFEMYEKKLLRTEYRKFQEEEYTRMTGKIAALLHFGLISEKTYNELWERAKDTFYKLALER